MGHLAGLLLTFICLMNAYTSSADETGKTQTVSTITAAGTDVNIDDVTNTLNHKGSEVKALVEPLVHPITSGSTLAPTTVKKVQSDSSSSQSNASSTSQDKSTSVWVEIKTGTLEVAKNDLTSNNSMDSATTTTLPNAINGTKSTAEIEMTTSTAKNEVKEDDNSISWWSSSSSDEDDSDFDISHPLYDNKKSDKKYTEQKDGDNFDDSSDDSDDSSDFSSDEFFSEKSNTDTSKHSTDNSKKNKNESNSDKKSISKDKEETTTNKEVKTTSVDSDDSDWSNNFSSSDSDDDNDKEAGSQENKDIDEDSSSSSDSSFFATEENEDWSNKEDGDSDDDSDGDDDSDDDDDDSSDEDDANADGANAKRTDNAETIKNINTTTDGKEGNIENKTKSEIKQQNLESNKKDNFSPKLKRKTSSKTSPDSDESRKSSNSKRIQSNKNSIDLADKTKISPFEPITTSSQVKIYDGREKGQLQRKHRIERKVPTASRNDVDENTLQHLNSNYFSGYETGKGSDAMLKNRGGKMSLLASFLFKNQKVPRKWTHNVKYSSSNKSSVNAL